jgi:glycerophosphoryl diester phosphodiesterase
MFGNLPKPAIIAHRGASAYAPENTLAAFKLALQQGADGIELDAKLSSDRHVVVIHDQSIDRTTPMSGRVRDYSMADLHKMDAGSHFDIAYQGEWIPSLEDVLKAVGQLTIINIELTNYSTPFDELPKAAVELVKKYKLNQRVLFSSFNILALHQIHRLMPEAPVGLLASRGWTRKIKNLLPRWLLHRDCLHIPKEDASLELIHDLHNKDQKVFVYTVNREEDIQRLFEYGVDGIFTDDPKLARNVLARKPHLITK